MLVRGRPTTLLHKRQRLFTFSTGLQTLQHRCIMQLLCITTYKVDQVGQQEHNSDRVDTCDTPFAELPVYSTPHTLLLCLTPSPN